MTQVTSPNPPFASNVPIGLYKNLLSGIKTNPKYPQQHCRSGRAHVTFVAWHLRLLLRRPFLARLNSAGRPFSDFIQSETIASDDSNTSPEDKAQELIDRTTALLQRAQAALEEVRRREPSDSKYRKSGKGIISGPIITSTSSDRSNQELNQSLPSTRTYSTGTHVRATTPFLSFSLESDEDDDNNEKEEEEYKSSSNKKSSIHASFNGINNGTFGARHEEDHREVSFDSWFGGKVDTGSVSLRPSHILEPAKSSSIAVMDRPNTPTSLEFAALPVDSITRAEKSIFPESLALRFQSEESEQQQRAENSLKPDEKYVVLPNSSSTTWERTTGEEFGPDGYWLRWTEIEGKDASGAVQWSERWWEVSDWKGMKELGAEKWGFNDRGDAWRESWRESIGFDATTSQPMVERFAHKWARAGLSKEWEEKWGESYLSGGKADKYADKWGRHGGDVWHEKWGESYDGQGGCVKWTDRWAERPPPYDAGGSMDKWGDKWEEKFKDGRGTKRGETWSESATGDRYQRWWGENHEGEGYVQKFGHSSTGEHWDVTERMDTYYNPIPHFGYDLALQHSPQLRKVPMLPRDEDFSSSKSDLSESQGQGTEKKTKTKTKTNDNKGIGTNEKKKKYANMPDDLNSIFG